MKYVLITGLLLSSLAGLAQDKLTPELLWKLGRVNAQGLTKDKKYIVYSVGTPDVLANKTNRKTYKIPVNGGTAVAITNADSLLENNRVSPDGGHIISSDGVKLEKVYGSDLYPELAQSKVQVYDGLNYRHWDTWEDGKFDHVFVANAANGKAAGEAKDIMAGELFDCPQKPFGGDEDFIWSPDSKKIIYVTKKQVGTAYAVSTNTDLFEYDLATGTTKNLTESNLGYDVNPAFNTAGTLAWLSMKRDGYESDKQDLVVLNNGSRTNLTAQRDDIHVESFQWSTDNRNLFFIAPINGTLQLFVVDNPGMLMKMPDIKQITSGDFDISSIVAQVGNKLIVTRTDINHAAELYVVDITNGKQTQLSHVNDEAYSKLGMCKTERRFVTTTDNEKMLVWVVYPPNFDPAKKYPTLLYCQGGPQSALTQFYSFRWNFQLMASQGYIVVAPNRRGMPGHGTKWNEQVSKDWGGQVMFDYLSAIDDVAKEPFVDKSRLGCVGASFGGFSVFRLAGMHNNRFKTFISHDGVFDFRSMYGTTDEMFFENWEKGGPYWDSTNAVALRSFSQSPSNFVNKWNTPIMIIQGGKDYRVSIEQGQQAFQAAQLKGIKSRFLYFPDENHWVLNMQNAIVWQREFYKWLKETL
ncbi:Dipeptidyl aminopeptidase/acylaminoacyl peptidase [Filimonas lacunae]|uniref:Dipeptidyl aminopeptidase/acylaminoacyl peptidase n=1 Tax=Filimonas lacunae TaxID=477680 RepID=A0A173MK41_9BACT|nr:alpha/beta fold hydrolase [Filimonas lacunae]BAV07839.1 prolyl oligopeptidase family protein [Filimonas lacunae]SIT05455.1 Dipeptidyl aminopeptidase/acylaminoacyl peptidase [Filimonas lacunae]